MLGNRSVVLGSGAVPQRRTRPLVGRIASRPAIAGRERLAGAVQQSVLMQLMLAMALISVAAILYLNQASRVSLLQFSISDLQRQRIELRMQNADLYAQSTSLQTLNRIETTATTRLHMTKPPIGSIVWISPVVPHAGLPAAADSTQAAHLQSEPVTWMRHAISFVVAQF